MAQSLAKSSLCWSSATVRVKLCKSRLWDQANSTHRLVIWRGMWIPWTSWKCAALHWLAWLPAHFFSLFDSHLPRVHSPFTVAWSSNLCCPFLLIFSCRTIGIFLYFFPGYQFLFFCYWLLCPAFPWTVSFQMFLAGLWFAIMLFLVYALLVLFLPCSKWKKPNHRYAKKLTIIASSYLFLFVFL